MKPQDLASFFALLTLLEPDTITCKLAARLAAAGTATDGETDSAVLMELRQHADQIAKELASVDSASKERRANLVDKFLSAVS
jgi:hypothetical protein